MYALAAAARQTVAVCPSGWWPRASPRRARARYHRRERRHRARGGATKEYRGPLRFSAPAPDRHCGPRLVQPLDGAEREHVDHEAEDRERRGKHEDRAQPRARMRPQRRQVGRSETATAIAKNVQRIREAVGEIQRRAPLRRREAGEGDDRERQHLPSQQPQVGGRASSSATAAIARMLPEPRRRKPLGCSRGSRSSTARKPSAPFGPNSGWRRASSTVNTSVRRRTAARAPAPRPPCPPARAARTRSTAGPAAAGDPPTDRGDEQRPVAGSAAVGWNRARRSLRARR